MSAPAGFYGADDYHRAQQQQQQQQMQQLQNQYGYQGLSQGGLGLQASGFNYQGQIALANPYMTLAPTPPDEFSWLRSRIAEVSFR